MEAERRAMAAEGRAAEAMAAVGRETAARKAAMERAAEAEARLSHTASRADAVEEAESAPIDHLQTPPHHPPPLPDAVANALAAAAERAAKQTAEAVAAVERSARAEADEVAAQHGAAMAILQARVAAAKGAGTPVDAAAAEAQALLFTLYCSLFTCGPQCIKDPPCPAGLRPPRSPAPRDFPGVG